MKELGRRFLHFLGKIKGNVGDSTRGMKIGFRSYSLQKIYLFFLIVGVIWGLLAQFTVMKWMVAVVCAVVLVAIEFVNTAIELLCDLVHPEQHPIIGKIKDLGSAATFVMIMLCLAVFIVFTIW